MPIRVTCQSCGKAIKAGDDWAGKRAKCPGCGADLEIPAAELQLPPPPPTVVESKTRIEPLPPPPLEHGHVAYAPSVNVHLPKRTSSVGVVSLILGILGFMFCWIPFIGILTIPLSGLGLLLGAIGLLVAITRQGSGVGWPIAGVAVCGLALFIAGSQVAVIGSAVGAARDATSARTRTNQQPATLLNEDDLNGGDEVGTADAAEATPESDIEWASAKQPVRQGDVQVQIYRVENGPVMLKDYSDTFPTQESYLAIRVEIKNLSSTKKVSYRTWQGRDISFSRDFASLTDNFDNTYKRIDFGIGTNIVGAVKSDSIYPGKLLSDALVYEPPLENVEFLNLELPAENFGGEGMLRIRIPREMFAGPDPAKLAADQAEREAAERERLQKEQQEREAQLAAERARLAAEEEAKFRTWTAGSGRHTTEAKLISYGNGVLLLENRDGKRIKVQMDKLSETDQEFVDKWAQENR